MSETVEQAAPAASNEESAAPETQVEDSTSAEQSAAPQDETSELLNLLPEDDGLEEIEHEGVKAKVPKELKDAFLRQADYTRKTQEVAEQKRAIEAQAAEQQRQAAFIQQNLADVAAIHAIDGQLDEYKKLDWASLIAQNPQQAQMLDRQMRELQDKKSQLTSNLSQKQRQQALNEQQATARRIQDGQQELARDIKGWSPELAGKLTDYGRKSGIPPEVLTPAAPAAFVKLLHKAMQWDNLNAQRSAKSRPAVSTDKPVTRVNAQQAPATKDPDKMSMEEWVKWDAARTAKRNKR